MFYAILSLLGFMPGLLTALIEGIVRIIGAFTGAAPVLLLAIALAGFTGGCLGPNAIGKGPQDMMSAVGELGKVVAAKIADEGTLQSFTSNLDGHVQDPGIESYVEIRAAAGVRAVGANGNITAAAHGDSTRLPAGMRDALIEQLKQPISDEQRAAILEILGWNRTQTP